MKTLEERLLKKGYDEFFFSFKEMKLYRLCSLNSNTAVICSEDSSHEYYVIVKPVLDKTDIKWDLKFGGYEEKEAKEYAKVLDRKLSASEKTAKDERQPVQTHDRITARQDLETEYKPQVKVRTSRKK